MINIAIIENEEEQIKITSEMIQKYFSLQGLLYEIHPFSNGFDFLEGDITSFDLIFMDIDMPGINGMETATKIREKGISTPLIFVTNLPQYAISGYKVQALDFILKPMTYADFSLAMKRALTLLEKERIGDFVLTIHGSIIKFKAEEVYYIDMNHHDVNLHLTNGRTEMFRSSLNKIEPLLDKRIYHKCNSGCIVNLNKVKALEEDTLKLENGICLPISRSKKKETLNRLNQLYSLNMDKE